MWWKKVIFNNCFLASAILSVISAAGIIAVRTFLPPVIPMFYGKPTGAEQLGNYWLLFIIPGVSMLISAVNLFISVSIKDEFIKKILAVSSLTISLMATVTVVKIILLVGFF